MPNITELLFIASYLFMGVNGKRSIPITRCDQLFGGEFIRFNDKQVSYHLSRDLNCKGTYRPIGYPNKRFLGKFDFNGHQVRGATIDPKTVDPITGKNDIFYWGNKKKNGIRQITKNTKINDTN